jgi:tetratricopeptide (TPR) repeat protein
VYPLIFRSDRLPPQTARRSTALPGLILGLLLLVLAAGDATALFEFDTARSPLGAELHGQVAEVMRHYYNFEFDQSLAKAQAISERYRQHPIGHFLIAESYFWRIINNPEHPPIQEAFDAAIRRTIKLSEERLEQDDRDSMALFFLGGAHGRHAILAGLDGRHFEAVQSSLTGRKYIKRLNKYHPEVDDAYFGLGLYDYYAAELPWFARLLSRLFFGLGGDKERGVAELERAAEHGLFTQVEAKIFLAIIYLDQENRYEEALAILKEINQAFPDNLDYYGMLAFAYRTQHDHANAIRMLEMLVDKGRDEPAFGHRSRGMSHYFLGSTYKVAGQFGPALGQLDHAIEQAAAGGVDWLLAIAHLERGRANDLLGQRDQALADYRRVLELGDYRDSHAKANTYIESPYVASDEEKQYYLNAESRHGSDSAAPAGDPAAAGDTPATDGSASSRRAERPGAAGLAADARETGGPDSAGRPD